MSKYLVCVTSGPRGDKYNYVSADAEYMYGYEFTDNVFDAVWYKNKMDTEIVRYNLMKKNYFPIVVSVENTIEQLDRENGFEPFYIIRDQSDNRIVREVRAAFNITLYTHDLKDAMKYTSAANAIDAINNINHDVIHPYDLVVEMHHFDEFYKEHEEPHFTFVPGGRGGKSFYLSQNEIIPPAMCINAGKFKNNYIISMKEMYAMFGTAYYIPEIKKVIFSNSVTIVLWKDGTKTIVRCQEGETFDPEKGLAIAFMKKAFGNRGNYYDKVRDLLDNATYQGDENHTDNKDLKDCKDDIPFAKKTKNGTYKCPHCSRFVPSKRIEGKKGPFVCDECGKKFNINWED